MLPARRQSWLALGAVLATLLGAPVACDSSGVAIELHWPIADDLAPERAQIEEVTLSVLDGTDVAVRIVRALESAEWLDMGGIAPGDDLRFTVELRSPTQRLLGYGRSALVDMRSGESGPVPLNVRRPFVYLAGGTHVAIFDTTQDASTPAYRGQIDVIGDPLAVATTADGAELLVATRTNAGGALHRVSTSDHRTALQQPMELPQEAVDMAVSADGRYAVLAHDCPGGGISVIDLTKPSGPDASTFVDLDPVQRVAVGLGPDGTERAYALERIGTLCEQPDQPSTTITAVPLQAPMAGMLQWSHAGPLEDMAAAPVQGGVVVVDRYNGTAMLVSGSAELESRPIGRVPGASTVAINGNNAWIAGTTPAREPDAGVRLVLVAVDLSSCGDEKCSETRIDLPAIDTVAITDAFSGPGDEVSRRITADAMKALEIIVLPDSRHIALTIEGEFIAEERSGGLLPRIVIKSYEYVLVDTVAASIAQRLRTRCEITVVPGPLSVGDWYCGTLPGQEELTDDDYIPLGLAALYGAK